MADSKLNMLYISYRLNKLDGSSIHSREFVKNVSRLGCVVHTFPAIQPMEQLLDSKYNGSKNFFYYLKKINLSTFLYAISRMMGYIPDGLLLFQGLVDSFCEYHQLVKLVQTSKPSIIVYRFKIFKFSPYWVARRFDIPIVSEVNALRSQEAKFINRHNQVSPATRWAEREAIRSSDQLFCVSREVKKQVASYNLSAPACVISNGVDTERFNPHKFDKSEIKTSLGLQGKIVLGYVGTYKTWHGTETAIEVMRYLVKEDKRYHLVMIGRGEAYSEIRQMAIDYGLSDHVTQIDQVPHEDIPSYMSAFDFALMSYPDIQGFHGSPLKLYEYMSMGLPVVGSCIGEFPNIIKNNHNGILVCPPSAENFAAAIRQAQDKAATMGTNARKLMEEEFTWRANAERIINLCQQLLSDRGGAGRVAETSPPLSNGQWGQWTGPFRRAARKLGRFSDCMLSR